MRKMKDSGVEWIGEIPVDWNINRVKHAFTRKNEKAMQEDPVILSLARSGVRVRDVSTNEGQVAESYYNYNPVEVDDLLLNPMDLYSGANCSISKVTGVISPAYMNLRYKENICPKFYDYYFKLQYWMMAFFSHGKGVSYENRWTLTAETLFNYPIVSLSFNEQRRIADYLDDKCARIDSIIEREQVVIEKLKDYKLSAITEVVTKGLNPNVPMKDSGVEWIGEIPEHWDVLKFGRCISIRSNLVNPEKYYEFPQISPESIEKNSGRLLGYKNVRESGVISWNHLFFKGQIIYSKIRPLLNKVVIAPFDGLCSADMYPIETANCVEFVVYVMLSDYFTSQVGIVTENRVKMPKINQAELGNLIVTMPPINEQHAIAKHLSTKCDQIDSAIDKKQTLIGKLTEYKKSLIYEVVTGKKEV